jgi:tetratricopeptide (TPR) repeat protein
VSAIVKKEKRIVIPRWRSFKETLALGELASPPKIVAEVPKDHLAQRQWEWSNNRTVWHAADLVGAAFIFRRSEVALDAAKFLVSNTGAPAAGKALATRLLDQKSNPGPVEISEIEEDIQELYSAIHATRERLQDDPRNAIQWIDLARIYTVIGRERQAQRAVLIAITLSGNNRFILRAAARFFVHHGEADRAHELVRTAPATRFDPWLVAAELALAAAAGAVPRFAQVGRKILKDESTSPSDGSELASELGTLELSHGKIRNAKKLFRQSLDSPNGNSLAQAEWAWKDVSGDQLNVNEYNVPYNFEALAWNAFQNGLWDKALLNSKHWLVDQPFSRRPAILASYVASAMLEDYTTSIEITERSLIPNPGDPILLNNLAFARARAGAYDRAQEALNKVDSTRATPSDQVCLYATQGLIYYRTGMIDKGQEWYRKAITLAAANKFSRQYAEALIHQALEEIRAHVDHAGETVKMASSAAEQYSDMSIQVLRRKLTAVDTRS